MDDFITQVRRITGKTEWVNDKPTSGIWYDLTLNPNVTASSYTGGVIKLVMDNYSGSKAVADALWGESGSANEPADGSVYKDIQTKAGEVSSKHTEVMDKYTDMLGTDGTSGKYKEFSDKYDSVKEHYSTIDAVGNDLAGKKLNGEDYEDTTGSRLLAIGENVLKGTNSELIEIGKDMLASDSKINVLVDNKDTIMIVAEDVAKNGNDPDDHPDTYSHIKHAYENSKNIVNMVKVVEDDTELTKRRKYEAEAARMTAESFSNEPYGEFVKIYTYDGQDGFNVYETNERSALHNRKVAEAKAAEIPTITKGTFTFIKSDGSRSDIKFKEIDSKYYLPFRNTDGDDKNIEILDV